MRHQKCKCLRNLIGVGVEIDWENLFCQKELMDRYQTEMKTDEKVRSIEVQNNLTIKNH